MVDSSPLGTRKKRTRLSASCLTLRVPGEVWTLPCLLRRSSTGLASSITLRSSPWLQPSSNIFELTLLHRRYEIAAMGLATSLGSWLLKSEVVYRHRQPTFFRDPTPGLVVPIVAGRHQLISGALGLSTSGDGWQLGVEATQAYRVSNREIEELQDSERGSWAVRSQFLFARDILSLSFIGVASGWTLEGGALGAPSLLGQSMTNGHWLEGLSAI